MSEVVQTAPPATTTPATASNGTTTAASSGSSSNKLAQEIYDEFLVCKICLDGYKNPKCLDCLHTFCETCIETHVNSEPAYKKYSDYREFTCPLCRKRTQLPVGGVKKLPDNFLVSSLTEVVGRQKPSANPFCDICKLVTKTEKDATSKCLDCSKLLCAGCVALHKNTKVTSNHSLFDVEIEKEIGCKDHQDEVIRFYCEPCESCVCILCTFNEHRDHAISQFQDVAVKYKANIESLLAHCKQKITIFETSLEAINKCESTIKQVEQKIRDKSIEYIQEIRNKEKQLLEELHQIYGQECFECIDSKKELVHQVENIRNTCNISEVILLGKEIELLLLKKDVEDKLNLMNQIDHKQLPANISKLVDFQTGVVDLGYLLHDGSKAAGSKCFVKLRGKKSQTGNTPSSTSSSSSRWMAVSVEGKEELKEGSEASVAIPIGTNFEIVETTDSAAQTDAAATEAASTAATTAGDKLVKTNSISESDLIVEDGDGVIRRRRRRMEDGPKQ
ncbi:hypothetical protein HELRODRAFT_194532 [Helobdella robusta]|uniref:RING-type domain-containing protein n=1 Tax=Helobdella robusta TaxID=6412 RepID=T1FW59_HELRO|nr:hypothetical protein HELRODRAFT_194532 [Helobdella robusta]ESN91218.1 hypothetical protein HELRODRAFT_194532 [Helobdella robusta]